MAVQSTLEIENLVFFSYSTLDYEETKPVRGKELDFADSLIENKSRFIAENNGASLLSFYSFDKAVAQLKGAREP